MKPGFVLSFLVHAGGAAWWIASSHTSEPPASPPPAFAVAARAEQIAIPEPLPHTDVPPRATAAPAPSLDEEFRDASDPGDPEELVVAPEIPDLRLIGVAGPGPHRLHRLHRPLPRPARCGNRRPEPAAPAPPQPRSVALPAPAAVVPPHRVGAACASPVYPARARRAGHEGTVVLALRVEASGRVAEVEVAEPSGHPALDQAAVRAARDWTFLPATRNDVPIERWTRITVEFRLER